MGSSVIQTRVASNWSATLAGAAIVEMTSPRDMSIHRKRQRDRLSGDRLFEIAVGGDDARHLALASGRLGADAVAGLDHAARYGAGEAAEIQVRPIDPLHGQAEWVALQAIGIDFHRFQVAHQRRAVGTTACWRSVR